MLLFAGKNYQFKNALKLQLEQYTRSLEAMATKRDNQTTEPAAL